MAEVDDKGEVQELQECVNGLCSSSKSRSNGVRGAVRNVLGILSPILVRSPDPRIKALGLAMGVLRETVYKKR